MKLVALSTLLSLSALSGGICAQIAGTWRGKLDLGATKLRVVLNIAGKPGALTATLDSPDQGATGIRADTITFADGKLEFEIKRLRATYRGQIDEGGNTIEGTFKQGREIALRLTRGKTEVATKPKRPQQPKPPYPYAIEDVYYSHDPKADTEKSFAVADANSDSAGRVRLAATLTLPRSKGPHAAVVLISGSGPQDRDETILGHKPFHVIADALTRRGIAVLRFDDRGVGKSTGEFRGALTSDFAKDAHAGVLYLKTRDEIDAKKIGLIGHSEGGLIAPIVATTTQDVAFIVMLAGPGVPGDEIILVQSRLMGEAQGVPAASLDFSEKANRAAFRALRQGGDAPTAKQRVQSALEKVYDELPDSARNQVGSRAKFVQGGLRRLMTPWFRNFLTYDPRPTLTKVSCPVLALFGEKDLQVAPSQNLPPVQKALASNEDATVVELPGLNHLFQNCKVGNTAEYRKIEETFDPTTLKRIADWIAKRFL